MNESGLFANAGDILVTEGFNGCTALIVRAELPDGQVKGFLAHKHAVPNRVDEFVTDFEHGQLPTDTKLYGTILYSGDEYGRTLGHESEALQLALQAGLRKRFGTQWHQLRSVRYAIYSGFPTSVNSNRLAYNIAAANIWVLREGAYDCEHPSNEWPLEMGSDIAKAPD
jgi:hypothetical protein